MFITEERNENFKIVHLVSISLTLVSQIIQLQSNCHNRTEIFGNEGLFRDIRRSHLSKSSFQNIDKNQQSNKTTKEEIYTLKICINILMIS